MAIDRLFLLMKEKSASDLFLAVNSPILLKINGSLTPINQQKLEHSNIMALLGEVVSLEQLQQLGYENELNIGVPLAGIGRFRLSAFKQRGCISAVIRYVPGNVPALDSLGLPSVLSELILEKHGLMLVVGATGSGKSTTIASMIDHRNNMQNGHILTIEDPIEYLFRNKKSIINQREIGSDAKDLQTALKNALRQAPDCILIGGIRDKETMSAALAYAQSGHLVVATLHANNSYHALNRIISFYPLETRHSLLQDLSSTIKVIVSQRLIPALSGGQLPAVEVMLNTRHIAELIEKGNIDQIRDALEKSLSQGSQTLEQTLLQMLKDGQISQKEAVTNGDSASNMLWMLNHEQPNDVAQTRAESANDTGNASTGSTGGAPFTEFTLNT